MRAIAATAGPGAVVLANPSLSWPLASFGPKVLLLLHDDPLVPDATQREQAVKDLTTVLDSILQKVRRASVALPFEYFGVPEHEIGRAHV